MPSNKPGLTKLLDARERVRAQAQDLLERRHAAGVEQLSGPDEIKFRAMLASLRDLDEDIETRKADDARSVVPEHIARLGGGESRAVSSAGRLAPLGFEPE